MPTAHIESKKEDIARLILMPGDPNRAEYIAKNYLKDYRCVNKVRGALAFTGYYKDTLVTVFTSGMGIPSMAIYSYELFKFYDVDVIIRIGSAGSYVKELDVRDLILCKEAYVESNYAYSYDRCEVKLIESNKEINDVIIDKAHELGIKLSYDRIYTTDSYYTDGVDNDDYVSKGCKAVDMETFALLYNANKAKKKATGVFTISNSFVTNEELNSEEREKQLNDMIKLALESIIHL